MGRGTRTQTYAVAINASIFILKQLSNPLLQKGFTVHEREKGDDAGMRVCLGCWHCSRPTSALSDAAQLHNGALLPAAE